MDKTPDNSSQRRSQKRPHSPQDEIPAPSDAKIPTTQSESVLETEAKRDKLLRLLGGKKRKNETAASKWLDRVRSREDELKVSTELESQFNESLTQKLTGATRRHLGIGFHEDPLPQPPSQTGSRHPTNSNSADSKPGASDAPYSDNRGKTQTVDSQNIVGSLAHRANVPSLSARAPRMGPNMPPSGYQPPRPYHGAYGMGAPNLMPQQNCGYAAPYPGPQGYPTPQNNYGYPTPYMGHNMPPNPGYGFQGGPPIPPTLPPPPPPPSGNNEPKPPEPVPKTKNAFYAQFKKAS